MIGAREIVAAIDRGFAHARAVRSLSAAQRRAARLLACRCADGAPCRCGAPLRLLPARGRWPRRYVVTVAGSYVLRTFDGDSDRFHAEVWQARMRARKAKVA